MCVTSDLLSTLAQPQALLLMTLVVQGPPWGYHHCLGTTPCTTRLEPWLPVSMHCFYTLVRLTQRRRQDPAPHCSPGRSSAPQSLHYQLRHQKHIKEPPGWWHMADGWDGTAWKETHGEAVGVPMPSGVPWYHQHPTSSGPSHP